LENNKDLHYYFAPPKKFAGSENSFITFLIYVCQNALKSFGIKTRFY
jgi:hypothetical protein